MKFRTVKIWLSKGWYYAVYSVSMLLVTIITSCSSSRSSAKNSASKETSANDSSRPVMVDSLLLGRTAIYGPPAVSKKSKEKLSADSIVVTFDYRDPNSNLDPTRMRLMYGVQMPQDSKPLLVVDGTPWPMDRVDKDILSKFDFDKDIYSRKRVAALLGFKRKELKAARMLKDQDAQRIWGRMGVNGVFEVVTTEAYYDITHLTPVSSADDYQLLK